jgi:RNA polymerase sigma factor (sigma-70 family)
MSLRIRLPARFNDPRVADDDLALVHRFAESHDETAFAGLVNRHARMVFGVCRRTVGDAHLAEDAFQAVFLVLARKPRQAAAASSVGGWLFGIARRVGLATRRHELRHRKHLTNNCARKQAAGEPDFDDLLRVLDEELESLPEAYRASLVACFLEERTQDEAAKQLGWSLSTLRRRLDRGKELLRARLLRRGVTLAAGLFAGVLAPSARAAVPRSLVTAISSFEPSSQLARTLASEMARGGISIKHAFIPLILVAAVGGLAMGIDRLTPANELPIEMGSSNSVSSSYRPGAVPIPQSSEQKPWVSIVGRVVFPSARDLPKPTAVPSDIIKDFNFFKGLGELFQSDVLIDPKSRGIANAVAWLRPDNDDRDAMFPVEKIHPDMLHSKPVDRLIETGRDGFTPRVAAARAGDRLIFRNPTPIAFNVNYRHDNDNGGDVTGCFNILLPSGGNHIVTPLTSSRQTPDQIKDSIHPWIRGSVRTFEHPYFAVTDELGNFQIKDAPEGSWRLVVWHEKIGYRGGASGRLGERISITTDGIATSKLEPLVFNSDRWDE